MAMFSLILILFAIGKSDTTTFKLDLTGETKKVWPFWELATTYDHAYPALRADWQQQLKLTHDELGTKYVRFMGTFNDDIGISNPKNPSAPYSYLNTDLIYDYIISIGMKPMVELDFVPSNFLKNPQSQISPNIFDCGKKPNGQINCAFPGYKGPPDNYTQWYDLVHQFVHHLNDRYGAEEVSTWKFDQWDEPNTGKWVNNNLTTFEETYTMTAKAVSDVNKSFSLGAPGTSQADWIPQFPEWTDKNNIKLDWVSFHLYPSKSAPAHDDYYQKLQHYSKEIKNINPNYGIGITAYGCTSGSNYDKMGSHDTAFNAACFSTLASQLQGLDNNQFEIMSFTGFTDLWSQWGMYSAPFHNGYGWLTNRGIKKPTFHALRLLHQFATDREYFVGLNDFLDQNKTTLELFATIDDTKKNLSMFIMNWGFQTVVNQTVDIVISGGNGLDNVKKGILYRMDDDNCNPQVVWQKQGSPFYPTQKQIDEMVNASNTYAIDLNVESGSSSSVTFKLDVPANAMALLVVEV